MIETRAGFLKLHIPYETYKDDAVSFAYRHVWLSRSAIRGLTTSNGLMGRKASVYACDINAYGGGTAAWECMESIEDILDAIERIDKESSETQIVNVHNQEG